MLLPEDRMYAETHEWALLEDDDVVTVGITDFAQEQLGDVVFVGDFSTEVYLEKGAVAGVVESVKAASDIYAPVAGTVVAVNAEVIDNPELLNDMPYETWLFKLKPDNAADLDELLLAEHYQEEYGS